MASDSGNEDKRLGAAGCGEVRVRAWPKTVVASTKFDIAKSVINLRLRFVTTKKPSFRGSNSLYQGDGWAGVLNRLSDAIFRLAVGLYEVDLILSQLALKFFNRNLFIICRYFEQGLVYFEQYV